MFSIVIPLYNKELSIENTIQSVLNQSIQDFEVLIVNDGSTDNSFAIVEKINDDRVRLLTQNNQGVSSARNSGIKAAQFEWIAFLDGDDIWHENHLEELRKMIMTFPHAKVLTTSFRFSDQRDMFKHPRKTSIFEIQDYFQEALREHLIWTSTVAIHQECFRSIGCFNPQLAIGEDLELWARLANKYNIIKSSTITAIYRIDAENRSSLSKDIGKTCVYHFDLGKVNSLEEKKYYKTLILKHLFEYSVALDFSNVIKLKNKHPEISYSEAIFDIFKRTKLQIKKRFF